ncbi:unnamed protein product [Caenorhabditis bovis]|uniref:M-phase inducer phosphatase n=1 Tax=Caenorhabditis bovis TaxID=2654633 RepID=A0A8S1E8G8_9PELO|nr:unnamed protein product [Caenorhabditis bovis]
MMSDEDSRDSGICDMDFTEMSTSFSMMNKENNDVIMEDITIHKKSCEIKIYDESPKSRTMFLRPSVLTIRSTNQIKRKNTFGGESATVKRIRECAEAENSMPSTSKPPPNLNRVAQQSGSISIHRAQSSSALERGVYYAKHHAELPQLLQTEYHLKTVSPVCSNAFRRISAATLHEVMSSMSDEQFLSQYVLIDCRYPYEYAGGHIRNAINLYDPADCESMFYTEDGKKKDNRIPIFYCEFSQKRGPSMAYALRRIDRQHNELNYPHCDYQEMYVLDKGYRNFYAFTRSEHISRMCEPDSYVEMDDTQYSGELRKWNFHKKSVLGTSVRNIAIPFDGPTTFSRFTFFLYNAVQLVANIFSTSVISRRDE